MKSVSKAIRNLEFNAGNQEEFNVGNQEVCDIEFELFYFNIMVIHILNIIKRNCK